MPNNEAEIAVLKTEMKHLTAQLQKLGQVVEDLTDAMSRVKGAFAVALFLSPALGFVITKAFDRFIG